MRPCGNCIAALTHGDLLRGTWHDRSGEYRARAAGKDVKPGEFTTSFDVKLAPLPCVRDMTEDERQAHYRRVVREIDDAAYAANQEKGRTPLGVEKILAQDPHHRPKAPDRSPAPLVHSYDDEKRDEYLHAYRVFVVNFRAGVDVMLAMAKQITELFPDWAFPRPRRHLRRAIPTSRRGHRHRGGSHGPALPLAEPICRAPRGLGTARMPRPCHRPRRAPSPSYPESLLRVPYHRSRTHLSLGKDAPEPRAVQPPSMGRIVALPEVGGLDHRYERRAA